jgi:hypothetical protein
VRAGLSCSHHFAIDVGVEPAIATSGAGATFTRLLSCRVDGVYGYVVHMIIMLKLTYILTAEMFDRLSK